MPSGGWHQISITTRVDHSAGWSQGEFQETGNCRKRASALECGSHCRFLARSKAVQRTALHDAPATRQPDLAKPGVGTAVPSRPWSSRRAGDSTPYLSFDPFSLSLAVSRWERESVTLPRKARSGCQKLASSAHDVGLRMGPVVPLNLPWLARAWPSAWGRA